MAESMAVVMGAHRFDFCVHPHQKASMLNEKLSTVYVRDWSVLVFLRSLCRSNSEESCRLDSHPVRPPGVMGTAIDALRVLAFPGRLA